jgi:hypothetical protein
MAVGMLLASPGFNEDVYWQLNDAIFGTRSWSAADVPGLILHSAGPSEGGFYAYDVWESREAFEAFMKERLAPAFESMTGGPPPAEMQPQFFEIANLVT